MTSQIHKDKIIFRLLRADLEIHSKLHNLLVDVIIACPEAPSCMFGASHWILSHPSRIPWLYWHSCASFPPHRFVAERPKSEDLLCKPRLDLVQRDPLPYYHNVSQTIGDRGRPSPSRTLSSWHCLLRTAWTLRDRRLSRKHLCICLE